MPRTQVLSTEIGQSKDFYKIFVFISLYIVSYFLCHRTKTKRVSGNYFLAIFLIFNKIEPAADVVNNAINAYGTQKASILTLVQTQYSTYGTGAINIEEIKTNVVTSSNLA